MFHPTITDWLSLCGYKQSLHCAKAARALAALHNSPFTLADDFFAKNGQDGCAYGPGMERIRQRLLDESAGIAKSEARREREGKR